MPSSALGFLRVDRADHRENADNSSKTETWLQLNTNIFMTWFLLKGKIVIVSQSIR